MHDRIVTGHVGSIWPPRVAAAPALPRRGLVLDGVVGSIRWGYYTAAGIHGYRVTQGADGRWSLTASVVLSDKFKMAQSPLTFVALRTTKGLDGKCVVKSEWRWPILAVTALDPDTSQLSARLGPPEEI